MSPSESSGWEAPDINLIQFIIELRYIEKQQGTPFTKINTNIISLIQLMNEALSFDQRNEILKY